VYKGTLLLGRHFTWLVLAGLLLVPTPHLALMVQG
jgi:hypothetical protein